MTEVAPTPARPIRVIELSHLIAGPYCGQLFADGGADVVKVEAPGGEISRKRDPLRVTQLGTVSGHFASMNRGKRSIELDLKSEAGARDFRALLATADVLITNMRIAALGRLDLDPRELAEEFPRLVTVVISGYGLQPPGSPPDARAGLAIVAEAATGVMSLTRDHNGEPVWCGFALGDIMAGHTGYSAAMHALYERDATGGGRVIDIALTDAVLPLASVAAARNEVAGVATTLDDGLPNNFHGVPYGVYPVADGNVVLGVNTDDFWRRLCAAMDAPEYALDERYATYLQRTARVTEVRDLVVGWFKERSRVDVVRLLEEYDVPVADVVTVDEAMDSGEFRDRGMLWTVDDGVGGTVVLPGDPLRRRFDGNGLAIPRLGQHTAEVLDELRQMAAEA
jgi:crotonobetainyl-CoA:carnitine CoA-transferase CaiB-like acyl-CoA transferase